MIKFKYKIEGINKQLDQKVVLYRYALNKTDAKKQIKDLNLENIKIKLVFNSFNDIKFGTNTRLNTADLLDFLLNLYDMTKLGVPTHEAIEFMLKIANKESLKDFYSQLSKSIKNGFTLGSALEISGIIDNYTILIIKTAEKTGEIDKALMELIKYYQDKKEMFGKIKSALVTPAITLILLFGASIFLILNVIPKIYGLFQDNPKIQPPSTTQTLYNIGLFLNNYTTISISIGIGIIVLFVWILRHPRYAKVIYYIPIIKNLKKYEFQAEFLMTLYLLIKSGTNINTALHMLYENEQRAFIKLVYKDIGNLYTRGMSFSKIVKKYLYLFDELVGFMFEKGEKQGTMHEVTENLYLTYKEKIRRFLEKFPETIKITTLIIGGGILLYVFLGILQPVIVFTTQAAG